MKITILTLFPEMLEPMLKTSVIGRALEKGTAEVELVQIQDYCPWRGIRFGTDPGPKAYGFAVKRGLAVKLDRDSFLLWTHGCVIHPEVAVFILESSERKAVHS